MGSLVSAISWDWKPSTNQQFLSVCFVCLVGRTGSRQHCGMLYTALPALLGWSCSSPLTCHLHLSLNSSPDNWWGGLRGVSHTSHNVTRAVRNCLLIFHSGKNLLSKDVLSGFLVKYNNDGRCPKSSEIFQCKTLRNFLIILPRDSHQLWATELTGDSLSITENKINLQVLPLSRDS